MIQEGMMTCGCENNARRTPPRTPCGCDGQMRTDTCDHGKNGWGLQGYPIAMVYSPVQTFDRIYDLDTALKRGTVFEALDLPFICGDHGKGGCSHGG